MVKALCLFWAFCLATSATLNAGINEYQPGARITISGTHSLKSIFDMIRKQTGKQVSYATDLVNDKQKHTLRVTNATIDDILTMIFRDRTVSWKISDDYITLYRTSEKQPTSAKSTRKDSIPLLTVKGTVTAEEGYPLQGATILLKESQTGAATNKNGQFILARIPQNAIITISYTGYESQAYTITGSETIIAKLKRQIGSLDEQVIVGYGKSSRKLLTGSLSKISEKDIQQHPVSNPMAALLGRASGLFVTETNGLPGSNLNVVIRGRGSIAAGTSPLYVINGVPYPSAPLNQTGETQAANGAISPLNSLNPSDIESITILKDGDATSIYGSRGANGVVLITTKKGTTGELRLDANVYAGVGKVNWKFNTLDIKDHLNPS